MFFETKKLGQKLNEAFILFFLTQHGANFIRIKHRIKVAMIQRWKKCEVSSGKQLQLAHLTLIFLQKPKHCSVFFLFS